MFISNEHKPAAGIITLQFIPLYSLRVAYQCTTNRGHKLLFSRIQYKK